MSDISAMAGVSVGTVSRVLSGKTDVAPDLAERVREVARKIGYERRPSERHVQFKSDELGSIAYLLEGKTASIFSDTFQQHFLSGVDQRVSELGGHLIYSSCDDEIGQNTLPPIIANKRACGAILKGEIPEAWIEKVGAAVPVVLLMSESLSRTTSSVICDNAAATYQLLHHLRALGHRRVGFIYEQESHRAASFHHQQREQAFLRYVEALGLEFHPEVYSKTGTGRNPGRRCGRHGPRP